MQNLTKITCTSLIIMLMGCSEEQKVSCSGATQLQLISQVARVKAKPIELPAHKFDPIAFIYNQFDVAMFTYTISSIRTVEQDKSRAICKATLHSTILLTKDGENRLNHNWMFSDGIRERKADLEADREISYTIRVADDQKEVFIEDTRGFFISLK